MQGCRGDRITMAMQKRHLQKLYAVSSALNVSESAVSRWKNNGAMTVENVIALCQLLDVSIDWLLLGRGHMDMHRQPEPVQEPAPYQAALTKLPAGAVAHLEKFLVEMARSVA
jgi:transcriptional regulator with XRE-family HTH domain